MLFRTKMYTSTLETSPQTENASSYISNSQEIHKCLRTFSCHQTTYYNAARTNSHFLSLSLHRNDMIKAYEYNILGLWHGCCYSRSLAIYLACP